MVKRDQSKGAKGPEHKRVRHTRRRALTNYLGLKHHFANKVANARSKRKKLEFGVFLRLQNLPEQD